MEFKLLQVPNKNYNGQQQILVNRGIELEAVEHYTHLTDNDIFPPEIFGNDLLLQAANILFKTIEDDKDICVIVDCDCDGYTSSAIFINYLYNITNENYILNKVHYFLHESKQHGLQDTMDWIEANSPELIVVPDAGSNDIHEMTELYKAGRNIIILDHHEIEGEIFPHCILINSQLPQYPNKELSGAGVTWQFCRYLDSLKHTSYADTYLDLVAVGLTGDMMSLKSFETRRLITKGLEPDRIVNPLIYGLWQKSFIKLGNTPTSWGVTFYIVPLINAITRSGTLDQKILVFESMLTCKAFTKILSNKKGHKLGDMERVIDQALRTCTNVKNKQTREETAGLELVEHLIQDNEMMEHKVLLFLLEPGQIQPEIRGLIANKLMAKYQRPCCMLTKRKVLTSMTTTEDGELIEVSVDPYIIYEGSARGCDAVGVTEFKNICAETGVCEYTIGHQGAFGLGIREENIKTFIERTDELLKDMASEPIYYVDYLWSPHTIDPQIILDIGDMGPYWGKDISESLVAIKDITITSDMVTVMASNTLKIMLPNGVSVIKFRASEEDIQKLIPTQGGSIRINLVACCNINLYNGVEYPQLLLKDYEIIGECSYEF